MASPSGREHFEIKLLLQEAQRQSVEHWLTLHHAAFIRAYPDRWVNNIYFDTHDFDALQANVRGDNERSKLRYRWYGSNERIGAGTLEVKQKRDRLGWKLRYDVKNELGERSDDWRRIRRRLRERLPVAGRLWLDEHPLPVIINRYHRRYFVSDTGLVRATIDSHQAVWGQGHGRRPNMKRQNLLPGSIVVEIKADEAQRAEIVELLQGFPSRAGRNSKYVSAVRSTLT